MAVRWQTGQRDTQYIEFIVKHEINHVPKVNSKYAELWELEIYVDFPDYSILSAVYVTLSGDVRDLVQNH